MRRRKLLSATGVTLAGGAATAYKLSRRPADDRDSSRDDESQNGTADPDANGGDGGTDGDAERSPLPIEDAEGMVVFTYDDSPIEDYTLTYGVHREYGVPGCIAACPGTMRDRDDYLDPEQLLEITRTGGALCPTRTTTASSAAFG